MISATISAKIQYTKGKDKKPFGNIVAVVCETPANTDGTINKSLVSNSIATRLRGSFAINKANGFIVIEYDYKK